MWFFFKRRKLIKELEVILEEKKQVLPTFRREIHAKHTSHLFRNYYEQRGAIDTIEYVLNKLK